MSERRTRAEWPIIAGVIVAIAAALAAYMGMYYWRTHSTYPAAIDSSLVQIREFNSKWEVALFQPAAKVEAWLIGRSVEATTPITWVAGPLTETP